MYLYLFIFIYLSVSVSLYIFLSFYTQTFHIQRASKVEQCPITLTLRLDHIMEILNRTAEQVY